MKKLFVQKNITIRKAYKTMNLIKRKSLVVIDKNKNILGILSDGDIRRSIIEDATIDSKIENIYNKNYFSFNEKNFSIERCKNIFAKEHYDLIPIVDKSGKIIKIIYWEDLLKIKKIPKKNKIKTNNVNVIIMAGGKAKRMGKISKIVPKPLLPYNKDLSLIEKIIENFSIYGMRKFNLILNYKSSVIKSFFNTKEDQIKLKFYTEKKFLGTAGGLVFIKNTIKNPFFLINCDTIINYDFNKIYKYHNNNSNGLTIITSQKQITYPYGVCELDQNDNLTKIIEKPNFKFLVNTGCYIINPSTLKYLPVNKYIDMNKFIDILINKKIKISVYPIKDEMWEDLGSIEKIKKNFAN